MDSRDASASKNTVENSQINATHVALTLLGQAFENADRKSLIRSSPIM